MTAIAHRDGVAPRRPRYDDGCLAAHALNIVGDRWALLVVRELLLSPKRFQGIRAGLPGITAAVLSTRLEQLVASGIVERHPHLRHYSLTPLGGALRPVVLELARWGVRHPDHDPSRFISPTSLMLSMSIMVDAEAATGRHEAAGFDLGTEQFTLRLDGRGAVEPTPSIDADVSFVLRGSGNALAAAVYGPHPIGDLVHSGAVTLVGDQASAAAFLALFSLQPHPPSASSPASSSGTEHSQARAVRTGGPGA